MASPDNVMPGAPAAPAAGRPMLSEAELERRRGRLWTLKVEKTFDLNPHMRRVQLTVTGDAAREFQPKPAQEIVLQIALGGDR